MIKVQFMAFVFLLLLGMSLSTTCSSGGPCKSGEDAIFGDANELSLLQVRSLDKQVKPSILQVPQGTLVWQDLGEGCCKGDRLTSNGKLWAGEVPTLADCQSKCLTFQNCGAIEYGWQASNKQWCFIWSESQACSSLDAGKASCGAGGGDNGVHAFKVFNKPDRLAGDPWTLPLPKNGVILKRHAEQEEEPPQEAKPVEHDYPTEQDFLDQEWDEAAEQLELERLQQQSRLQQLEQLEEKADEEPESPVLHWKAGRPQLSDLTESQLKQIKAWHAKKMLPGDTSSGNDGAKKTAHKSEKGALSAVSLDVSKERVSSTSGLSFDDAGVGCCSGQRDERHGKLWAGEMPTLQACQQKCQEFPTCGAVEYGWAIPTQHWCFIWDSSQQCESLETGFGNCGGGGDNRNVRTYKLNSPETEDSLGAILKGMSPTEGLDALKRQLARIQGDADRIKSISQEKVGFSSSLGFKDAGAGCCSGERDEAHGKLWAGPMPTLDDCMQKCNDYASCGTVEYGWGFPNKHWCFIWDQRQACTSFESGAGHCGAGQANEGVRAYRKEHMSSGTPKDVIQLHDADQTEEIMTSTSLHFEDVGAGCCSGTRDEAHGKLWAGAMPTLDSCKQKCHAFENCGMVEYGWGFPNKHWCFIWDQRQTCESRGTGAGFCGDGHANEEVKVYKSKRLIKKDIQDIASSFQEQHGANVKSHFKDLGPGCCSGKRDEDSGKLWAGNVSTKEACMERCRSFHDCGTIEYGWGAANKQYCFIWSQQQTCDSLEMGSTSCGAAGGNDGVHAYMHKGAKLEDKLTEVIDMDAAFPPARSFSPEQNVSFQDLLPNDPWQHSEESLRDKEKREKEEVRQATKEETELDRLARNELNELRDVAKAAGMEDLVPQDVVRGSTDVGAAREENEKAKEVVGMAGRDTSDAEAAREENEKAKESVGSTYQQNMASIAEASFEDAIAEVSFEDSKPGCCVGSRDQEHGKLWAGAMPTLDACKQKCKEFPNCGVVEYGWIDPGDFCFIWDQRQACASVERGYRKCGGGGDNSFVNSYKVKSAERAIEQARLDKDRAVELARLEKARIDAEDDDITRKLGEQKESKPTEEKRLPTETAQDEPGAALSKVEEKKAGSDTLPDPALDKPLEPPVQSLGEDEVEPGVKVAAEAEDDAENSLAKLERDIMEIASKLDDNTEQKTEATAKLEDDKEIASKLDDKPEQKAEATAKLEDDKEIAPKLDDKPQQEVEVTAKLEDDKEITPKLDDKPQHEVEVIAKLEEPNPADMTKLFSGGQDNALASEAAAAVNKIDKLDKLSTDAATHALKEDSKVEKKTKEANMAAERATKADEHNVVEKTTGAHMAAKVAAKEERKAAEVSIAAEKKIEHNALDAMVVAEEASDRIAAEAKAAMESLSEEKTQDGDLAEELDAAFKKLAHQEELAAEAAHQAQQQHIDALREAKNEILNAKTQAKLDRASDMDEQVGERLHAVAAAKARAERIVGEMSPATLEKGSPAFDKKIEEEKAAPEKTAKDKDADVAAKTHEKQIDIHRKLDEEEVRALNAAAITEETDTEDNDIFAGHSAQVEKLVSDHLAEVMGANSMEEPAVTDMQNATAPAEEKPVRHLEEDNNVQLKIYDTKTGEGEHRAQAEGNSAATDKTDSTEKTVAEKVIDAKNALSEKDLAAERAAVRKAVAEKHAAERKLHEKELAEKAIAAKAAAAQKRAKKAIAEKAAIEQASAEKLAYTKADMKKAIAARSAAVEKAKAGEAAAEEKAREEAAIAETANEEAAAARAAAQEAVAQKEEIERTSAEKEAAVSADSEGMEHALDAEKAATEKAKAAEKAAARRAQDKIGAAKALAEQALAQKRTAEKAAAEEVAAEKAAAEKAIADMRKKVKAAHEQVAAEKAAAEKAIAAEKAALEEGIAAEKAAADKKIKAEKAAAQEAIKAAAQKQAAADKKIKAEKAAAQEAIKAATQKQKELADQLAEEKDLEIKDQMAIKSLRHQVKQTKMLAKESEAEVEELSKDLKKTTAKEKAAEARANIFKEQAMEASKRAAEVFDAMSVEEINKGKRQQQGGKSKTCVTKAGDACAFPFVYKGRSFDKCTYLDGDGSAWCATNKSHIGWLEGRRPHVAFGICGIPCQEAGMIDLSSEPQATAVLQTSQKEHQLQEQGKAINTHWQMVGSQCCRGVEKEKEDALWAGPVHNRQQCQDVCNLLENCEAIEYGCSTDGQDWCFIFDDAMLRRSEVDSDFCHEKTNKKPDLFRYLAFTMD